MQTILIVDDKTENLYLLQSLLQGNGYAVKTAAHGAEALHVARSCPPALCIADILMPVMDGFTLCRAWRRDETLRAIPFLFYTATYTDEKDEQFALSLGADRFIVKPAEPQFILDAVRSLLEPGSRRPQATGEPANGDAGKQDVAFLQEYNQVLIRKLEDKLEDLEHANAELRSLDLMKDNLLRNVSHEFRTPLSVVLGYVELIASGRSGPITEQQAQNCTAMRNNVERLLHMINNLIFLADPKAQEKHRHDELLPIIQLTGALRDVIQPKAMEKGVTVTFEGPEANAWGDYAEVLQALFNLLDNAVKFTPKGGVVSVSWGVLEDWLRIGIKDSGAGIAAEEQQRIFERFYQVDPTTTRRHGGLGLGLSIARELALRRNWRIELDSKPGEGSTFTLVLPQSGESKA